MNEELEAEVEIEEHDDGEWTKEGYIIGTEHFTHKGCSCHRECPEGCCNIGFLCGGYPDETNCGLQEIVRDSDGYVYNGYVYNGNDFVKLYDRAS